VAEAAPPRILPPSAPSLATHKIEFFKNMIRSIARFRGELWVGTYGSGAYRLTSSNGLTRVTTATHPCSTIVSTRSPWWAPSSGWARAVAEPLRRRSVAIRARRSGIGGGNIYHTARVGPDGAVWVGTTGQGLSRYGDGTWTTFHHRRWAQPRLDQRRGLRRPGRLRGDAQRHLAAACRRRAVAERLAARLPDQPQYRLVCLRGARNELWAATAAKGVWTFQDETWYHPPTAESLPSEAAYCLEADGTDRVWIGTDKGVVSYTLEDGFRLSAPARALTIRTPRSCTGTGTPGTCGPARTGNPVRRSTERGGDPSSSAASSCPGRMGGEGVAHGGLPVAATIVNIIVERICDALACALPI